MKRRVLVVAALIESGDRPGAYLVQQRLPGKSRALLWEFPGGKVEAGETEPQALERECREELAVALEVGRRSWSCVHEYADLVVELVLYAARIREGQGAPQPLGAHALRYCTPEEMRALPFCEADLPLLEELASGKLRP
ncbi:MAG TPA: (deoxy)nucleoside triphosphate pyrophosphohydrolase [Myxococcaceae bacterium]|jgi:8-oxo-dGTP diphosphatase